MWLPASIYERLPQIWLLIGLGIFGFSLYLGFDYDMIFAYLGLGSICIVYSLWLFVTRRKHRDANSSSSDSNASRDSDNIAAR